MVPLTEGEALELQNARTTSKTALFTRLDQATSLSETPSALLNPNVCSDDGMKHIALYMRMLSRHVWKISALDNITAVNCDTSKQMKLANNDCKALLYGLTCKC